MALRQRGLGGACITEDCEGRVPSRQEPLIRTIWRSSAARGAAAFVVAAFALLADHQVFQAEARQNPSTELSYLGFTFAPGRCDIDQSSCAQRGPKDWTADDRALVKRAIDAIVMHPTGKSILERAQRRRFDVIRRYVTGLTNEGLAVSAIAASVHPGGDPTIEMNDRFFAYGSLRDAHSGRPGYLVVAQLLLHECIHAIDDLSGQPEFLTMLGFRRAGQRWRFAVNTESEIAALVRFDKELAILERAGDWPAQWRLNRDLALNMRPTRVPTMHSVRSPAEAFADIASHLILDPNARKYLPSQYASYFDSNVFASKSPSERK